METLLLKSNSKRDLNLLLNWIKDKGLKLEITPNDAKETLSKTNSKLDKLKEIAKRLDNSVKANTITMQEIVEETRIVRNKNSNARKSSN